jgi:hypothetical protein
VFGAGKITHGHKAKGKVSVLYTCWQNMKDRCHNPNNDKYEHYGGRDIAVFSAWQESFEAFRDYVIEHIGQHPGEGYSIHRIDNDENYEPGNIRWATKEEQTGHRRAWGKSSFNGVSHDVSAHSKPWKSEVHYMGKKIFYKRFVTEAEAAKARDNKVTELGLDRPLNFPQAMGKPA